MRACGMKIGKRIKSPHPTLQLQEIHGKRGPILLALCPMGAPSAAFALELLIVGGVRRILFFGFCGALRADVKLGSLVLPQKAFREEGTSYHYAEPGIPALPSPEFYEETHKALVSSRTPFHTGPIWTTDAPFRETSTKIQHFKDAGALAVEMEVSALLTVAAFRKVSLCAMLAVTDTFMHDHWSGFKALEGLKGWTKMCRSGALSVLSSNP